MQVPGKLLLARRTNLAHSKNNSTKPVPLTLSFSQTEIVIPLSRYSLLTKLTNLYKQRVRSFPQIEQTHNTSKLSQYLLEHN